MRRGRESASLARSILTLSGWRREEFSPHQAHMRQRRVVISHFTDEVKLVADRVGSGPLLVMPLAWCLPDVLNTCIIFQRGMYSGKGKKEKFYALSYL